MIEVQQNKKNPQQFHLWIKLDDLPAIDLTTKVNEADVGELEHALKFALVLRRDQAAKIIKDGDAWKWLDAQPNGTFSLRKPHHFPKQKPYDITPHRFGWKVTFKDKGRAALFKQMFCQLDKITQVA